jgi:hypothetical protein
LNRSRRTPHPPDSRSKCAAPVEILQALIEETP